MKATPLNWGGLDLYQDNCIGIFLKYLEFHIKRQECQL